ncbi:MAG: AraC family transcriptional regulator [Lachnospiraceae bacterium]|nr:AraC family transcriptional regulator [Lachnospiraceae bacterium]
MENPGYEKRGYLYDDFRMFHIVDEEEREYPFHYHDFYKLLIFLKGSVTYSIEGKSYRLKPHDMVLVNKGAIHRPLVEAKEPYERIVFYISEAFLERHKTAEYNLERCFEIAGKEGTDVLRFPAMTNSRLLSVIEEIEKNGQENEQYAAKLYANVLFMEFMILVNRCCIDGTGTFNRAVNFNQKMIDLIKYIGEHLTEELSIEDLAAHFYISKFHMMRQFKEETGYTIHRYITEKRVLLAKSLMAAGVPPTQACYQSGFRDYSTFLRAYKRRLAQNPSENKY